MLGRLVACRQPVGHSQSQNQNVSVVNRRNDSALQSSSSVEGESSREVRLRAPCVAAWAVDTGTCTTDKTLKKRTVTATGVDVEMSADGGTVVSWISRTAVNPRSQRMAAVSRIATVVAEHGSPRRVARALCTIEWSKHLPMGLSFVISQPRFMRVPFR